METAFHGPVSRRVMAALDAAEASEKDLKARLKEQFYDHYDLEWCSGCKDPECRPCLCRRARDLRRKNWRKP